MIYFIFFLFFFIFVIVLAISILGSILSGIFSGIKNIFSFTGNKNKDNNRSETYTDGKGGVRQKIIGNSEGEYVNFVDIEE